MRRAYLLVYNDLFGTREQIKNLVDSMPEIIHWRYDMPHCFYLISEAEGKAIAEKIKTLNSKGGRFLVTEITKNKQGWLPQKTWDLINKLKRT